MTCFVMFGGLLRRRAAPTGSPRASSGYTALLRPTRGPEVANGLSPAGMAGAMYYDALRRRVVLFGVKVDI